MASHDEDDEDYLGFLPFDELMALLDEDETVPWLIHPLIPVGGWINLYGQPKKARKSYWALGASHAIADPTIDSFLGFSVMSHGPALILQADTPWRVWAQREKDFASGGHDLTNVYSCTVNTMPYPINVHQHEDVLYKMVRDVEKRAGCPPVHITYDTSAKLRRSDENQAHEATLFMDILERIAGEDVAKTLVSHQKKAAYEGDPKQDDDGDEGGSDLQQGNRGSGAIAGAVDTTIKITPKGMMFYEGRVVGEHHKRLRWEHVHDERHPCPYPDTTQCMGYRWASDDSTNEDEAKKLLKTYKKGSVRSLARLLAKARGLNEETARSIINRLKLKGDKS